LTNKIVFDIRHISQEDQKKRMACSHLVVWPVLKHILSVLFKHQQIGFRT